VDDVLGQAVPMEERAGGFVGHQVSPGGGGRPGARGGRQNGQEQAAALICRATTSTCSWTAGRPPASSRRACSASQAAYGCAPAARSVSAAVRSSSAGVVTVGSREVVGRVRARPGRDRSEEHTSELQSRENLVCRL